MRKLLLLALLLSQSVMGAIVAPLPFTIVSGTQIQANPLQSNFNWLMNQTNANAAPSANPTFTGTVIIPTLTVTGTGTIPTLSSTTATIGTLTVSTTSAIPIVTGGTTFTGAITETATGSPIIFNTAVASRLLQFQTSGVARWYTGVDGASESGGNSGSNWQLIRTNDAGTTIDAPLSFVRSTGVGTFTQSPLVPTPSTVDNSTKVATTAYVQNQSYVGTTGAQIISGVKTFTGGNEPVATNTAKAWVVFNGTTTGTFSPNKAYNVSNITRTGVGTYSINFTNAMTDTNYSVSGIVGYAGNDGCWINLDRVGFATPTGTTVLHIETSVPGGRVDADLVSVTIFD